MKTLLFFAISFLTISCASHFPRPTQNCCVASTEKISATEIFTRSFNAHGGKNLSYINDVSMSLNGDWPFMITRLQPLVTDSKFRVRSNEVIFPNSQKYIAAYRGPSGTKGVIRDPKSIAVTYNREFVDDKDITAASAMTADAFFIFSLGPLAFPEYKDKFVRLSNKKENGREYYRIYLSKNPGIGFSERDEVVLWIDTDTFLTERVHITLEGFRTTKGAHANVTYREYKEVSGFTFPSRLHERVRGPIRLNVHTWWLESLEINSGLDPNLVNLDNINYPDAF